MEEHKVGGGLRSAKWIALLFICFSLFCFSQAFNVYLRIENEARTQQITDERDRLKKKLQDIHKYVSEGWVYFGGSWYLNSTAEHGWHRSRLLCQERGADLIIINDEQEQEFARLTFPERRWIGLSDEDQEGVWKWVDGSVVNTSFWHSGQPSNTDNVENCGEINYFTGGTDNWNDYHCTARQKSICEAQNPLK